MNPRYERGPACLDELDEAQIGKLRGDLRDVAPDFAAYLVEFTFGDIHARPGLDLRSDQIAILVTPTVLGNAGAQLGIRIFGALNVDLSRADIVKVIMRMAVCADFPAALNGLATAKEVFGRIADGGGGDAGC